MVFPEILAANSHLFPGVMLILLLHLSERYPQAVSHPFFGEWIAGYISKSYQDTNRSLIERLDTVADCLNISSLEHLSQIFRTCSYYELGFWNMSWNASI